jgi:hypothetical protein
VAWTVWRFGGTNNAAPSPVFYRLLKQVSMRVPVIGDWTVVLEAADVFAGDNEGKSGNNITRATSWSRRQDDVQRMIQ